MKDYSQAGEQQVILDALKIGTSAWTPPNETGRFLDIGAWDPCDKSNTRALVELGWSGVFVEPSPTPLLNLINTYGNDERYTVIGAAVAVAPGVVKMHITDDAVSSPDGANYEQWKDHATFHGSMLVPTITLEQIFNQFGGFDFINIDAEGLSADLLIHLLGMGTRPPCICVEHDNRTTELMSVAGAAGYVGRVIGANLILWR